jgi:hypothetical protein
MNEIRLTIGLAMTLACLLLGCGGGGGDAQDPAGNTPDAPDTLVLPQSFSIAASSAALTSGSGSSPSNYSSAISEGAGLAAESEQLLTFLLSPFQNLKIPVGSATTQHQSTLTITNGSGTKSVTLAAAVDLSDFDLDGDGNTEGCSGHSAALPICLRIWLDGERFLAGRLDAFPGATSPGAGRLTIRKTSTMPAGEDGMGVSVIFDHTDPNNISSEMFWGMPSNEMGSEQIVAVRHVLLTKTGEPTAAVCTLNLADEMAVTGTNTLRYLVRYRVDQDLWSGSVEAQGMFSSMLGIESFDDVCVDSTTGQQVADTLCTAAGISISGLTSVPIAGPDSVALPADFPSQPTF